MKQQQKASSAGTSSSITLTSVVLAAATSIIFFLAANISTVESRDDLTTIRFYTCNEQTLESDDPFLGIVRDLLETIVDTAPGVPGYTYSTWISINGVPGYAHGDCDPDGTSDDCKECLTANSEALFDICLNATGAQIVMNGCYMRYENYRFW